MRICQRPISALIDMNAAEQSHEPRHERRQAVSAHVNAVVSANMGTRHWMTVPSMVSGGGCGARSRLMQTASLKVFMVSHGLTSSEKRLQSWGVQEDLRTPQRPCPWQGLPRGCALR